MANRLISWMSGVHLPVQPMEHHYLVTEDIPEIVERGDERLPAGIDYEGNMYFRQEGKGMLLGTYEPRATPWSVRGTPRDSSAFQATFFPARLELDGEPLDRGAYLRPNITHS